VYGPNIQNFKEVYTMLGNLNISSKVNNVFNMQKIILKKIKYKQSRLLNQKLFSIGKKILIKNLFEIKKYI
jgi:3-deoxy-D-manno-octulosonic-acid transferase